MDWMLNHILAFALGFLIDLLLGDPYCLPHPIRWIGSFIDKLTHAMLDSCVEESPRGVCKEKRRGLLLVVIVTMITVLVTTVALILVYIISEPFGIIIEGLLIYYTLATKSLWVESMKVYKALQSLDIDASRQAVSMIVGRDTAALDETGVAKAAVETVAENSSDGVIAPMLYCCIGGPVLGMLYKAVNTMDSMVGYHNDRYEYFGYYAAKLDDILNYIPSRISAFMLIAASFLMGKDYDTCRAIKIFLRDRYNHKSPNSAQTESVMAGALGIRLAGDACYFGRLVKKPYIGDDARSIEVEDIRRANRLMYVAVFITFIVVMAIMIGIHNVLT